MRYLARLGADSSAIPVQADALVAGAHRNPLAMLPDEGCRPPAVPWAATVVGAVLGGGTGMVHDSRRLRTALQKRCRSGEILV